MDSLSLSGCGKAAAFPDQDEPPAVGATANLWGRDVISLNDIDVQRLAQRALKSDFSVLVVEADFQPAGRRCRQSVNRETSGHLDNFRKLVDALKSFGYQHPFYPVDKTSAYASEMQSNFSKEFEANISNGKKCNILVSLFLARQLSSEIVADSDLLEEVFNLNPGFFSQYLRCVELYRQMSEQPISMLQVEQVQELYELVQETEFFPAAWLLVKLALNDENRYLFSPFFLPSLLSPFLHRSDEVGMMVNVFSARLEDAMIYFNKMKEYRELNGAYQVSPVDVFMAHVAAAVSGSPVTNNQWLRQQSGVSESMQMKVFVEWSDIIASRRAGGRGYIRSVNTRCSYEQVNDVMTESGKKFMSKRQFKSMRAGLFKQHDKDAVRRRFFVQLLQDKQVQDSPFLVGVTRLTQSLMYQCSANVSRRPMTSLMYLVQAAESGVFPLLHKNAGDIYFGFGLFEKARLQYQRLYSHSGLPESLKKRLESLIEMCELNIPAPLEAIDHAPAPVTQKKTGKVRHRQRKKTTSATDPVSGDCASGAAAVAPSQRETVHQEESESLPEAQGTPRHDPIMDGRVADQYDDKTPPENPAADPVPAGFATVSYSRVKKTGVFRPKSGNFSDQNFQVRRFIRQVNCFRNEADLAGEKECIERWLQDELVYGRICEDAAWFYLRQCILPIQLEREVLDCDLRTMEKGQVISEERMLGFALSWVARAMSCYLESSLDRRVRSSRLKEILVGFHEHYPDKKLDFEICKRLRSGCSGFGHVFSEWSALVSNSKLKGLHMQKGHEFFALKRIADPLYYQQEPETAFFGDRKVAMASDTMS